MPRVALQHGAVSSRMHVLNRAQTLSESATLDSASDETELSTSEQALKKLADVRLTEFEGDDTTTPKPKPTRKVRAVKPKSTEPKATQRKPRVKKASGNATSVQMNEPVLAAQLQIPNPLPKAVVAQSKVAEKTANVAGGRVLSISSGRQSRPRAPQTRTRQVAVLKSASRRGKRKQSSSSSSSSDSSTDSSRDSSSSSESSSSSVSSHSPSSRSSSSSSSASDRSEASAKTNKKHRTLKNKQIKKKKTAKRRTRRDDDFIVVKDPPKFSGNVNDTDVKDYKSKAKEFISQFKSRSTRSKLIILRMGLSGPAREAVRRNRRRIKSPKSLFAMLEEYYPRVKVDPSIIVQELKQERNEPVSVFRVRVETAVAESGFKTISQKEQAQWGVSVFIRGLRTEVRKQLCFSKFSSLQKAVKAAIAVETQLNELNGMPDTETHDQGNKEYQRPRSPRSDKRHSEPHEKYARYSSPPSGSTRTDTDDRNCSDSNSFNVMDNQRNRSSAQYPASYQKPRFPILCFYCGKTGHRVYHCQDASEQDRRAIQDSFKDILTEVRLNTYRNFKDFSRRRQQSQPTSTQSHTSTSSSEPPKSDQPTHALNSNATSSSQ